MISGMRRNAELFIWVDVHRAIAAGIRFTESSNGVILCDGLNGILPPQFFTVVIELREKLMLSPAQVRLIERLFSGCRRVTCTKLHGGFSGSLVLKTDSYDEDDRPEEPTIKRTKESM